MQESKRVLAGFSDGSQGILKGFQESLQKFQESPGPFTRASEGLQTGFMAFQWIPGGFSLVYPLEQHCLAFAAATALASKVKGSLRRPQEVFLVV